MYFYIYCDIFTLFDSVSFTLQCSDQNYYNPNWNHVTHSPPWTLKCLSCRALLKKTKKNWIQYSPAPSWKYTPRKNDSLFLVQGPGDAAIKCWPCVCQPQLVPFISESVSEQSVIRWGPTGTWHKDDPFQQERANCAEGGLCLPADLKFDN